MLFHKKYLFFMLIMDIQALYSDPLEQTIKNNVEAVLTRDIATELRENISQKLRIIVDRSTQTNSPNLFLIKNHLRYAQALHKNQGDAKWKSMIVQASITYLSKNQQELAQDMCQMTGQLLASTAWENMCKYKTKEGKRAVWKEQEKIKARWEKSSALKEFPLSHYPEQPLEITAIAMKIHRTEVPARIFDEWTDDFITTIFKKEEDED